MSVKFHPKLFTEDQTIQGKMMNVTMHRFKMPPLTNYNDLTIGKRKQFDKELNALAKELTEMENGIEFLEATFIEVMKEEVFTENFNPKHHFFGGTQTVFIESDKVEQLEEEEKKEE